MGRKESNQTKKQNIDMQKVKLLKCQSQQNLFCHLLSAEMFNSFWTNSMDADQAAL